MLVCCRSRWWSALLVAVLAAGTAGVARAQPAAGRAAAFDRLLAHLDADATTLDLAPWRRETARLAALVPPGDAHRRLRHQALACAAGFDDVQAGYGFATRALADARALGNRRAEIGLLYCQSQYREQFETSRAALEGYEAGLAMARALGDARLIAEGLDLRGSVHSLLGDQGLALLDFLEAQALYERNGRRRAAEANLQNIAIAYRRMGEYGKALEYLEQGRALALAQRDRDSLVFVLLQTGFAHEGLGRPDQALAMYREVERIARRDNGRYDLATARLGIAGALVLKREFDEALRLAGLAQRAFTALGDTSNDGMIELVRGQAQAGLGRHAAALLHFDRAARDFEATANERYLTMLYPERAASLEAAGRLREAVDDTRRLLEVREALRRKSGDQATRVARYRFDAARRDLENRRLADEKARHAQEVAALRAVRRWQWLALGIGAALVLTLAALVSHQVWRARRLRSLALTDELTGVANRRGIERLGADAFADARRGGRALSVLTLDIDRFKPVNDRYGHFAGDEVLVRVAQACQASLRQFDRLGRVGGEEFLVLLPDTAAGTALPVAERLRRSVSALVLDDLAPGLRVTLSIGIAALEPADRNLDDLTRRADRALYRAKRQGRDRVELDASTGAAAPPAPAIEPAQAVP